MTLSAQIAKHLRDVYFGGNWTVSNLKDQLTNVTWQQATTKVSDINTIATLVFHMHYFVRAQIDVLEGRALISKDELSFDHPPIHSRSDWENFLETAFTAAEKLASLIENLPEHKLMEDFSDKKYSTYFRNLQGNIEHIHYHLGQIALIKKLI